MLIVFFFIACGLIALQNVEAIPEFRIANGQSAHPGQIPFQAFIYIRKNQSDLGLSACGGSLINSRWVLTAAHCVPFAIFAEVYLGVTDLKKQDPGRVIIRAEKVIIHNKYKIYSEIGVSANDIALIKLSKPVKFTSTISTISLPKSTISNYVGKSAIVSGFGRNKTHGIGFPGNSFLQYASLKVISNTGECKPYANGVEIVLCGKGDKMESACHGDSGGPFYLNETKPVLIGISSFGTEGCDLGYPNIFTRVSKFLNWISKNTGISV